jgi:hypothetical protein
MTPGIKSTEFLGLAILGGMVLADGTQYVNIEGETLRWFGAIVGAYIGGRSWVKASNEKKE